MTTIDKAKVQRIFERAMNKADLSAIGEQFAADPVDHQEPPGTDTIRHLKEVIIGLHTAFPDLNFEVHNILTQGNTVAFRCTMTGTHRGPLNLGPMHNVAPTGKRISVPHMYFLEVGDDGKATDLWHLWDIPMLMRQLGVTPEPRRRPAQRNGRAVGRVNDR
ncbi:MAG: ester cyclase [Anaerolineae bacterium]|nr:ester cyclase [Anaerolineae bacterium]